MKLVFPNLLAYVTKIFYTYCILYSNSSLLTGLSHSDINKAYLESTMSSLDTRVAMISSEGSGKTCLSDTLTGQEFQNRPPTEGVNQMEVVVKSTMDWKTLTQEELIDGLQQQLLHEAHHCATSQPKSPKIPNADSTATPTPDVSAEPLFYPNQKWICQC